MRKALIAGPLGAGVALALVVSGCGGASTSTTTRASATAATSAAAATVSAPATVTAPTLHLSIVSPRAGAHTGSTLTVRVAVSGAPGAGAQRFRYVLDHRLTRSGSSHLTFHDLAPGHHRLEVVLTSGSAAHAGTTFIVRTPPPVAVVTPVEARRTTPEVQQTTPEARQTTPEVQQTTTRAEPPPPARTSPPPPPPESTPAPATGSIPQGNGGDGDGDNNGAASDGDGNI